MKQLQKEEALQRMRILNLSDVVIKDFETLNKIYYSERFNKVFDGILYWVDNDPKFVELVKQFEDEHSVLVYHCHLGHYSFGDCLTLLFVSENQEEWIQDQQDLKNKTAFVYVYNLDDPMSSEFGTIGIVGKNGGVSRIE